LSLYSFELNKEFVSGYKDKESPFGFKDAAGNSVGEITFLRTYSRKKEDGTKETWSEVCERVTGNAKREATCFKEFKNLNKYRYSVNIEVPIPDPWDFNQTIILTEINNLKGNIDVPTNILTE
jgi:hypothetical protein